MFLSSDTGDKKVRPYYLDTNVLVSQYKPSDIFYRESLIIIRALKRRGMRGYTSPLTLVEMVSFVSRNFPLKRGEKPEDAKKIAVSKILKEIASFQLEFSSPTGDYSLKLGDQDVRVPAIIGDALGMSSAGLKTLDLMHLVAAKYCRETVPELSAFVTGDNDFLLQKRNLSERVGIPFLSPRELVRVMGLA